MSQSEVSTIKTKIEQFMSQMGITFYDADDIAQKKPIFADSESMVERTAATKGKYDGKWHLLRGGDALHVALAMAVNADAIATFDDDFRGVHSFITPLMLQETY